MKYISRDRLGILQEAVRRATNGIASLRIYDPTHLGDRTEKPIQISVHFASSGDMSSTEIKDFACQLITLTMVADEITSMKIAMSFHSGDDEDPELTTSEDYDKAGEMLTEAFKTNEGGKAIDFIRAGIYEKEA